VASGACRDVLFRQAVLEDFPACRRELPRRAAKWWRIERVEICGKRRDHRRAQRMCDVEHDVVCSSMLNESLQLIFQICGLLSGEGWYRVITTETLRRNAVADGACPPPSWQLQRQRRLVPRPSLNQRSTLTVFPLADFLPLLMASLMKCHFSASRIDGGLVKTLGDASLVGLITLGITGRSVA
jgi:hypothetical protein